MIDKYKIVDNPKPDQMYHLAWANPGCVWRLKSFDNAGNCIMVTPKTGRELKAKTIDLRHTRKNENK